MIDHPPSNNTRAVMAAGGAAVIAGEALGLAALALAEASPAILGWLGLGGVVTAETPEGEEAVAAIEANIQALEGKLLDQRLDLSTAQGQLGLAQEALKRGGSSAAVGNAQRAITQIASEAAQTWSNLQDQKDALAKAKDACNK